MLSLIRCNHPLSYAGYGCWTISKSGASEFQDVLGNLMDMHEVVVPLLHQVGGAPVMGAGLILLMIIVIF